LQILIKNTPYRDVPRRYGAKSTLHRYFQLFEKESVFKALHQRAVAIGIKTNTITGALNIVDGSDKPVKNMDKKETGMGHKHRGKNAIKMSLVIDENNIPLSITFSKANLHDSKSLDQALEDSQKKFKIKAPSPVIGDKGYDGEPCKNIAKKHKLNLITPAKSNTKIKNTKKELKLLKHRVKVEHVNKRLFDFKRMSYILDRKLSNFAAWGCFACALMVFEKIFP
jgi:transposase